MKIFSVILPVRTSELIASELLICLACYLVAVPIALGGGTADFLFARSGILRILLVCLSILIGMFVNNFYAETKVKSRVQLTLQMCNVAGIALIAQGLLAYISSGLGLPRAIMLIGSAITFVSLLSWRVFYSNVLSRRLGTRQILFIGNDVLAGEIALRVRRHPELAIGICGYLDHQADSIGAIGEYLGPIETLPSVVDRLQPDRIVVGGSERRSSLPLNTLLTLSQRGILIEEVATTYESICGRVSSRDLRASQIVFRNELASRPGSLALQSIYANLVGIAGVVITAPVLLLAAIAVKVTSRGPILEPDVRIGQHGVPFLLNRFRCHRVASAGDYTSPDERLTTVGRWLQRLHLVNLPRVFNLLRGEITLVGPRPERPEFADELSRYFAYYRQRFTVKPGLTGWSQINTSPETTSDSLRQLEYDIYYTKHISLALDAYILLHGMRRLLPFARH